MRGWLVRKRDGKAKRAVRLRLATARAAAALRPDRQLQACTERSLQGILRCTDPAQVMSPFDQVCRPDFGRRTPQCMLAREPKQNVCTENCVGRAQLPTTSGLDAGSERLYTTITTPVAQVQREVAVLAEYTGYSAACCAAVAEADGAAALLRLMRGANRSAPHAAFTCGALATLRNMARRPGTAATLLAAPACAQILGEQLQLFRDQRVRRVTSEPALASAPDTRASLQLKATPAGLAHGQPMCRLSCDVPRTTSSSLTCRVAADLAVQLLLRLA